MLLRRLVLVLIISSLFSVGFSRRHGGTKRKRIQEQNPTTVPVTVSPPEPTTPQTGQPLTKKPDLHSNDTLNNGTRKEDKNTSNITEISGHKPVVKAEASKTVIVGKEPKPNLNGTKTEDVSGNKTKSNVGKDGVTDVAENHLNKVTPNLKVDKDSAKVSNESAIASPDNKTEGSGSIAVPERADLDEDLSYTDEGGFTEMLSPASKGVADIVNTFLTFWGPGQAWMSIKQILFFHIFIISFYYLLVALLKGCIALINLKRTPLLIYKEVEDYKEEKPYPAPVLPPPHKDYGYEGGFKTPTGEQIQYVSYHEPHEDEEEHGDEGYHVEGPPEGGHYQEGPPEEGHHQGGPPVEEHHGPPRELFHEPPPLGHEPGPVVPKGGGGDGHHELSSYTSYAEEVKPHPARG